jgi:hypothetical protein
MPRNAQREELPVLHFSGRGEFCSTDSGFWQWIFRYFGQLHENCSFWYFQITFFISNYATHNWTN